VGDEAVLTVNGSLREATCDNHSATHLLQAALKKVLGDHVQQKGSYVDPARLRFDFVHFKPMTPEEIREVEDIVNKEIRSALEVSTQVMSIDDARKTGAMALFGEKYGENVRVVSMGDFSKELCGGTHVKNTGDIRAFKIVSESGIAAGVRRIEAISADAVFDYYRQEEDTLHEAAKVLKSNPSEIPAKIAHLLSELRAANAEIESLKSKAAQAAMGDASKDAMEIDGVKVLVRSLDNVDMNEMRTLGDSLEDQLGEAVIVLASSHDGKVNLMATATEGAIKKGAHAGNLVKAAAAVVGGGGGGRPNMAQAGGKDPSKIGEALELARQTAVKLLGK
jgi:alanyl-tRNA synthetase